MGCGQSNAAVSDPNDAMVQFDQKAGRTMASDQRKDSKRIKLLLLGAGEAGKSTVFRQLVTSYTGEYNQEMRLAFLESVERNILEGLIELIRAATKKLVSQIDGKVMAPDLAKDVESIVQAAKSREERLITPSLAASVEKIWNDPAIQASYALRSELQLPQCLEFFIMKVNQIATTDYVPTMEDCIKVRRRTVGVNEAQFTVQKAEFSLVDVGGQRNERRKWIQAFEHVRCVLFVAALSEYDQRLFEDENVNRMVEAIELFDQHVNLDTFAETDFIILFNKSDLFAEKIKRVPLKVCFPEYSGPQEEVACYQYIVQKFMACNRNPRRTVYYHKTCATDTENIRKVFDDVKASLITEVLEQANI